MGRNRDHERRDVAAVLRFSKAHARIVRLVGADSEESKPLKVNACVTWTVLVDTTLNSFNLIVAFTATHYEGPHP